MTATAHIMIMLLCIDQANANDYALAVDAYGNCAPGYAPVTDATTCEGVDWTSFASSAYYEGTTSVDDYPPVCYYRIAAEQGYFNFHPTGTWGDTGRTRVCFRPSTTTTLPMSGMFGDPILVVNGRRIKFDLPKGETLMYADGLINIFAVADLMTPDGRNQWFSRFMFHADGAKVAMVEQSKIMPRQETKSAYGQTLSLVLFDNGVGTPAQLGSYDMANGAFRLTLKRGSKFLGKLKQDVVSLNASSVALAISSERAKKYADEQRSLKYSHLDLQIQRMDNSAKAGLIAEFYGYVPMRRETAKLIRSMHL